MSDPTIEWVLRPKKVVPKDLIVQFPNQFVQQRLLQNNISELQQAKAFIDPTAYTPTPAQQIPDLQIAAERIVTAIAEKQEIGIWGDFDVDGQTATTLLVQGLRSLGCNPRYHIPDRQKESHGIKVSYLEEFIQDPIQLLITCDTGISEFDAIQMAAKYGIDSIISDHHSLPPTLPDAFAVVNPQRLPEKHPLRELSGVGVAYKLMEAVFNKLGKDGEIEKLVDLVALGTIADVAILNPENHYLVQKGLDRLRNTDRLLLKEIFQIKKINPANLNEEQLSFYIAPLLNAIGRLDNASPVVEHLLSNNLQEVRVFVSILENLNERRKLLTEQIYSAALSLLEKDADHSESPALVLYHPEWFAGVLGIVASRLVELFSKPVILLTGDPDEDIRGSGRSIEGVNLVSAIRECSKLLTHFGGHAMAAGLSLPFKNLAAFKNNFNQSILEQTKTVQVKKVIMIDDFLDFEDISLELCKELSILAPFGPGNPPFIFASRNVTIHRLKKFGKMGRHARLVIGNNELTSHEFLWWQAGDLELPQTKVDIAYKLTVAAYKNQENIQIEVVSIRLVEEEQQVVLAQAEQLEIIDFRNEVFNLEIIRKRFPDVLVWEEGLDKKNPDSISRLEVRPASCLVVHTSPPNLLELAKVWKIVNPTTLILASLIPATDSINRLLQVITGMAKYVIEKQNGNFNLQRAAAQTGQRVSTIYAAIKYLSAKGVISYSEHPDAGITISLPGLPDPQRLQLAENLLRFHLRETASFRKMYTKIDPGILLDEMVALFATKK